MIFIYNYFVNNHIPCHHFVALALFSLNTLILIILLNHTLNSFVYRKMIYITFGRLIDRNAHSHTSATMCPCYVDRLLLVVYMLQPFRWLLTCIALLLFSLILHQLKSFSKKKKKKKSIIYCSYFTNLNIKEFLHLKLYITKVLRLIKLHINFFFPYSCQMGREERKLFIKIIKWVKFLLKSFISTLTLFSTFYV